jgi:hypothetical protein
MAASLQEVSPGAEESPLFEEVIKQHSETP